MYLFCIQSSFHYVAYIGDSVFGHLFYTRLVGLVIRDIKEREKIAQYTTHFFFILVLSTVIPQPWYRGPTKIFELNDAAFRDKVLLKKPESVPVDDMKGPRITEIKDTEEKKPDVNAKYWIVMLYANWSVTCLNFEPVLAKLSIKYDLPHLKFGKHQSIKQK